MGNWFDVFKTGTHTDTTGKTHVVTPEHLKLIERKFNESNEDAPLVVGHPKTNDPAYGWAKRFRVIGEKLQVLAGEVVPEFAESVRKRMFKKISLSLRPDWSVRHIGFLGAVPPAVKGLIPVPAGCFAEEPGDFTIEFAEGELNFSDSWFALSRIRTIGRMMQSMRDYILGKDGLETADKVVSQYDIDFIKEEPPPDKEAAEAAPGGFHEAQTTPVRGKEDTTMEVKKTETPAIEKPGEFAERVATLETQNASLLEENKTLKRKGIVDSVTNFVEGLGGKLLPKFKRGVIDLLVDLQEHGQEINFSETEKKPSGAFMMEFLEALPAQVPTKPVGGPAGGPAGEDDSDFAEVETDPERMDLHKKAKALAAKENIPYAEAVRRAMKGGN